MAISDKHQTLIRDAWKDERYIYLTGDNLDIRFQTRIVDVRRNHLVLHNSVTPEYLTQFHQVTQLLRADYASQLQS